MGEIDLLNQKIDAMNKEMEKINDTLISVDKRLVALEVALKGNGSDGLYTIVKDNRETIKKLNSFIVKIAVIFTGIGMVVGMLAPRLRLLFRL